MSINEVDEALNQVEKELEKREKVIKGAKNNFLDVNAKYITAKNL